VKILQVANGDFFSTYGGGQVYIKNIVDEMVRQNLDVAIISFVNKESNFPFQKQNYNGINLYEIYQKDENLIKSVIQQIKPDIIHIHTEKAKISKISRELIIPNVITAHHGGITCPAGTLLNYKDEICKLPVDQKNCMRCVLRNTKSGEFFYPFLKILPLSIRLKLGKFLSKLPFIYFVTPIISTNFYIEKKQNDWNQIIQNADKIIAPSYAIADNMILNRFPKEKITIVPHGIPISQHHCRFNPQSPCNELKFFYVGRIGYIKGIHLLLKAFAQLDASRCELHLVGNIKDRYAQKLMKQYRKYPNIVFHGKIQPENIFEMICQWDILIHPAIYLEVFGLNIGEALAQGKLVIATRCGGAEMQIQNRINGLLIEPNQPDELKNAIQWMLDHPIERQQMAENAFENVVSLTEHVKELIVLYEKIIGKNETKTPLH